jgi:hypothetical protein
MDRPGRPFAWAMTTTNVAALAPTVLPLDPGEHSLGPADPSVDPFSLLVPCFASLALRAVSGPG